MADLLTTSTGIAAHIMRARYYHEACQQLPQSHQQSVTLEPLEYAVLWPTQEQNSLDEKLTVHAIVGYVLVNGLVQLQVLHALTAITARNKPRVPAEI